MVTLVRGNMVSSLAEKYSVLYAIQYSSYPSFSISSMALTGLGFRKYWL